MLPFVYFNQMQPNVRVDAVTLQREAYTSGRRPWGQNNLGARQRTFNFSHCP